LSANSLGKKGRYALHFWGPQNFDNSSKTFTIDPIPFILLKGFPIHLSHTPDIKKYDPNVFPIKGTHEDLWWNCRANMTYVICTMNPIGGDHTHQVFARTSGDSILIHGHEQQNLTLYKFDEPSITNCIHTCGTWTKSLPENWHFRAYNKYISHCCEIE